MTAQELFLDAPTCQQCHCAISLRDGCEWPEDLSLCLCDDCAIAEIVRLREDDARNRADIRILREALSLK